MGTHMRVQPVTDTEWDDAAKRESLNRWLPGPPPATGRPDIDTLRAEAHANHRGAFVAGARWQRLQTSQTGDQEATLPAWPLYHLSTTRTGPDTYTVRIATTVDGYRYGTQLIVNTADVHTQTGKREHLAAAHAHAHKQVADALTHIAH